MNFKEQAKKLVDKMTIQEKMSQMCYNSPAIERLGIPAYNWWNECLHGLARNGTATVFPQAIAMASTFNKERIYEVASAISDEVRAKYNENKKQGYTDIYQGLTMCSPNINIFRDPRWGRGHETFGEDPVLTAKIATEYVKGLQGDGKYRKVDATLKHLAVHSGPEAERHGFNVDIDEKTLYDTYLYAFKYCIQNANPSAVMSAYNAVNKVPCSANPKLLKDIIKDEFGFDGYIESDAGGVEDIHEAHKLTNSPAESAALAVKSGCDLCIGSSFENLPEAYEKGYIDEKTITESVTRLFETRFRLGMFASDCEYDDIPYEVIDCKKHYDLNLQTARESIVLLKNDGILPLKKDAKIAVVGPNADDISVLLANYNGRPSKYVTLLQGVQSYSDNVLYAKGCDHFKEPTAFCNEKMHNEALIIAKKCDVVVMCMGLNPDFEGEEADEYSASLGGDKASISLPKIQRDLYERIKKLNKPIIFVNVSGSCMALGDQKKECNAVIQCFYPGALGGKAFADILFGEVSPSGRLPVTFYEKDEDLPDFKDYSMQNRTYRFFKGKPVFPFGYGLTYSQIEEKWLTQNEVEIVNYGPYDTFYSVLQYQDESNKKLLDFKKVFIKNNEKIIVQF